MKMMKTKYMAFIAAGSMLMASCDLDEKFYSEVTPDNFFTSPEAVYAVLAKPFDQWRYYHNEKNNWVLEELTTDEMACPARAGDFYNGGEYLRYHYHTWNTADRFIVNNFNQLNYVIARSLEAREDLGGVNYTAIGLTEEDKADHLNQINTLLAYCYMRGLSSYGGLPIYTSSQDKPKARNTRKENFDFIEKSLKEAIPKLKERKSLGEAQNGYITRGTGAMLLAQLYFNAQAYIGENHMTEAEAILQDIYDGKYGAYQIDPKWYGPHTFDNDKSPEAMWYVPSQTSKKEFDGLYRFMFIADAKTYFDCNVLKNPYNGYQLAPSYEKEGVELVSKLGRTYSKFHDQDLRKKPYVYNGNKKYEGMFCVGLQKNPHTGKTAKGTKLQNGKDMVLVDYINRTGNKSDMMEGDENSGIRLVKMPVSNSADKDILFDADFPVIRFTEVVYNLAECKFMRGDKKGAADLINSVRKRNFEGGVDPDPVTEQNLDLYRLADEYMIEFLGEGHRRTDLIRWNLFTTESWWDHTPTDDNKKVFCIPLEAIQGNPQLEQNPGY